MLALDRFWRKVDKSSSCWAWKGRLNSVTGRAYFDVGRKRVIAARWIWQQMHGTIPAPVCVLHCCNNPRCVKPAHLFLGTQLDNIRDRDLKGRNRLAATSCVNGHPLAGENVRFWGPNKRWRACRECLRVNQRSYRARLQGAEAN